MGRASNIVEICGSLMEHVLETKNVTQANAVIDLDRRMAKKKKKPPRREWQWGSREPWIRILEILSKMSFEERQRCIRATEIFYKDR